MSDALHSTATRRKTSVALDEIVTVNLPGLVAVKVDAIDRTITVTDVQPAGDTPRHYTDDMRPWTLTDQRSQRNRGK